MRGRFQKVGAEDGGFGSLDDRDALAHILALTGAVFRGGITIDVIRTN